MKVGSTLKGFFPRKKVIAGPVDVLRATPGVGFGLALGAPSLNPRCRSGGRWLSESHLNSLCIARNSARAFAVYFSTHASCSVSTSLSVGKAAAKASGLDHPSTGSWTRLGKGHGFRSASHWLRAACCEWEELELSVATVFSLDARCVAFLCKSQCGVCVCVCVCVCVSVCVRLCVSVCVRACV